ncbi:MAG: marine proteobacterial sortase target protein [Gammaproteobacteria bacterium]|nr:MAG: marine proteobacterial sortase target protein [Gammaproteobacteria bacterium]
MLEKNRLLQHLGFTFLLLLIALSLISSAVAAANSDDRLAPAVGSGELHLQAGKTATKHNAVLLSARADIDINAISAAVTLRQTFENNSPDWVEGTYVFPLPENAAVDSMEMHIGDKRIIGKIRKKKEAKAIYKAAVENGQKATLVNMARDNLFVAKAGNIAPNEKISVILHYVQPTHYDNGLFSLRLPTTYTPRYMASNAVSQVVQDNAEKPIAQRTVIKNEPLPKQHFSRSVNHPLSINIKLNAGEKITQITSPSHHISKTLGDNNKTAEIHFANGNAAMDKDVVLRWTIGQPENKPLTLAFSEKTTNGYFTSLLFMPPTQKQRNVLPRETVFIIDTSGSMGGVAIRQAKAGALDAIAYLRPEDRFNIVEFNSDYSMLFKQSQPATGDNIRRAKDFIQALNAGGGTEMYAPLKKVLTMSGNSEYLKQIVFLTDGSVDNEQRLFELISQQIDKARLFTIGIGSAPNSFFMRQAASFGRGTFTYIGDITEVKNKINTLFKQLQHPTLTDISVALPSSLNAEIYPDPMPDLYLGQPVVAHIKSDSLPTNDSISISGKAQGEPWLKNLNARLLGETSSGLDKLWAREKINKFNTLNITTGDPNRHDADIEQLGLAYQLVTKKTSFVAVEEKITRDPMTTSMKKKAVANQMPAGNTMAFPQTATSSTLTAILGAIALLLAMIAAIIGRYQREYA